MQSFVSALVSVRIRIQLFTSLWIRDPRSKTNFVFNWNFGTATLIRGVVWKGAYRWFLLHNCLPYPPVCMVPVPVPYLFRDVCSVRYPTCFATYVRYLFLDVCLVPVSRRMFGTGTCFATYVQYRYLFRDICLVGYLFSRYRCNIFLIPLQICALHPMPVI